MDTNRIKSKLEQNYHIGFIINEINEKKFDIYPLSFKNDGFHVLVEIENDLRLIVYTEPQKYGAKILKLIEKSNIKKRKYCINIAKAIKEGECEFLINDNVLVYDDFVEYDKHISSFMIKYTLFPFNRDENIIFKAIVVLLDMFLSLLDYSIEGFEEGSVEKITSNKYERNPLNRSICLAYKGYKCVCCGFDFEECYGDVGKETIEVHHTTPVSKMGENYVVDPVNELVPVCSNCHTIIHKRKEPYTIEEVKNMIRRNDNG